MRAERNIRRAKEFRNSKSKKGKIGNNKEKVYSNYNQIILRMKINETMNTHTLEQ